MVEVRWKCGQRLAVHGPHPALGDGESSGTLSVQQQGYLGQISWRMKRWECHCCRRHQSKLPLQAEEQETVLTFQRSKGTRLQDGFEAHQKLMFSRRQETVKDSAGVSITHLQLPLPGSSNRTRRTFPIPLKGGRHYRCCERAGALSVFKRRRWIVRLFNSCVHQARL